MKRIIILVILGISVLLIKCSPPDHIRDYKLINQTDKQVVMLLYCSQGLKYQEVRDSPVSIPLVDSIRVLSNEQITAKDYSGDASCGTIGFIEFLDKFKKPYWLDSVEIIFNNERHISVINNGQNRFIFDKLNQFWEIEGRFYEECTGKRGACDCTFTYFITDEMYEQATPICR